MVTIRKEQLEAFLPKSDEEIIDFIVKHLQDESPELIDRLPEDSLREMIGNGMKRARKYDLTALADVTGFVSIMFEISPLFDEIPEIQSVLCNKNLPPEARFSLLFEKELDEAWEKAADLSNLDARSEAWYPELKDKEEQE